MVNTESNKKKSVVLKVHFPPILDFYLCGSSPQRTRLYLVFYVHFIDKRYIYIYIYIKEKEMATHSSILAWKFHGQRRNLMGQPKGS